MNFSEMSLDELLWYLNNIHSRLPEHSIQQEGSLLLDDLILEIIERCQFRPFEERPWTLLDFQFNLFILEELDLDE